MIALLQQFCSKDQTRESITTPFSIGAFTYATDGRIMIRVAQISGVGDAGEILAKTAPKMFSSWTGVGDWKPLPDPFVVVDPPRDCQECDASGWHECDCGHEHPCAKCDGKGKITSELKDQVKFGEHTLAGHYVRLASTLPGVQMRESAGGRSEPVGLHFDGGEGLLMPLRT